MITLTDEIKAIDNKIKANEAQYNLDREAAKISALSSGKLDKFEYLTGKDLGYKSGSLEQAKSEYSPLGQVFNKGLEKDDKKDGVLKKLEQLKNKTESKRKRLEIETKN